MFQLIYGSPGNEFVIGAKNDRNPAQYYNGSIDELMIWNRTLSASEVSYLYNMYDSNCTIPSGLVTIYNSTNFCPYGNYNLNGTVAGNGAIEIGASNIVLDCKQSTIYGNQSNGTISYKGLRINNVQNVTIKNCNFSNYKLGYYVRNSKNITFINTYAYNNFQNLYLDNVTISNFINVDLRNSNEDNLYLTKVNNTNFYNFTIYDSKRYPVNYDVTNNRNNMSLFYIIGSSGIRVRSSTLIFDMFNITLNSTGQNLCTLCNNLTMSNGFIQGGATGLYVVQGNYTTVNNVTFTDLTQGIDVTSSTYPSFYTYIIGSTFYNFINDSTNSSRLRYPINLHGNSYPTLIYNNSFINNFYGLMITTNYTNMTKNNFVCESKFLSRSATFFGSYFDNVYQNIFRDCHYGLLYNDRNYQGGSSNISFNTFVHNDRGLLIYNHNLTRIYYNIFDNNTADYDNYNLGMFVWNSSNLDIKYNNFINVASGSAWVSSSSNINFTNNTHQCINIANRRDNDLGYYPSIIQVTPTFKTFININDYHNNSIQQLLPYESNNVNIVNDTFDNNCIVRVQLQGGYNNLVQNIGGYYFYRFQAPDYLFNITSLYINPSFNNVSRYQLEDGGINETIRIAYNSNANVKFFHWITNTYSRFFNANLTQSYTMKLFNLTKSIIYVNNRLYLSNITNMQIQLNVSSQQNLYVYNTTNITNSIYWNNALFYYANKTSPYIILQTGNLDIKFNPSDNLTHAINNYQFMQGNEYDNEPFNVTYEYINNNNVFRFYSSLVNQVIVPVNLSYNCLLNYVPRIYLSNGTNYQSILYSCSNNRLIINNVPLYQNVNISFYSPSVIARIKEGNQLLAITLINGTILEPYHLESESGCSDYTGSICSTRMFSDYQYYTLLTSGYDAFTPNWAYENISCMFLYNNQTSTKIVQAFKVSGNGGQYCSITNKWDWYIYSAGFGTDTDINLSNIPQNNISFKEIYGFYPNVDTDNSIPNNGTWLGGKLDVDFSSPLYLVLLVLAFITICILLFYGFYAYAGLLTIVVGLVLWFSGVLWIIVVIVIVGGVAMALIPDKRSYKIQ